MEKYIEYHISHENCNDRKVIKKEIKKTSKKEKDEEDSMEG
jgi:hypothetical protein